MGRSKTSVWVFGTVFVCVVILAGAWLLAISGKLAAADEAETSTTSVKGQNEVLEQSTAALKARFANLDDTKAQLAGVRVSIPPDAQIAALIAQLDAAAVSNGVVVVSVTVDPSLPVLPPEPSAVPAAAVPVPTAEPTTGAGDADPAAATDAATAAAADAAAAAALPSAGPTAGAAIEGFSVIPIQVTISGTYPAVRTFIEAVQTGMGRMFLVTSLSGQGLGPQEAAAGRPATAVGDVEMVLGGQVFVLQDEPAAAPAEDVDAQPLPPLPGGTDRNPFVPVGPAPGTGDE